MCRFFPFPHQLVSQDIILKYKKQGKKSTAELNSSQEVKVISPFLLFDSNKTIVKNPHLDYKWLSKVQIT